MGGLVQGALNQVAVALQQPPTRIYYSCSKPQLPRSDPFLNLTL